MKTLTYLFNRFKEPSTYVGMLSLFSTFGIPLTPSQEVTIYFISVILFGIPEKEILTYIFKRK